MDKMIAKDGLPLLIKAGEDEYICTCQRDTAAILSLSVLNAVVADVMAGRDPRFPCRQSSIRTLKPGLVPNPIPETFGISYSFCALSNQSLCSYD
jgi:hypothetical protein